MNDIEVINYFKDGIISWGDETLADGIDWQRSIEAIAKNGVNSKPVWIWDS